MTMQHEHPLTVATGQPFGRVVVPLDGSSLAESAIHPAAALARRSPVPVTFFRWEPDPEGVGTATQYLERAAAHIPGLAPEIVVRTAEDGEVAESLVAEAAADHGLICLGSHARSAVGKVLLGSVTAQVLRLSPNPVLVIGPKFDPFGGFGVGEGRVVVGLDGSDFAERILPAAAAWATQVDMPLWLVEVVSPADIEAAHLKAGDVQESAYLARMARTIPMETNWDVVHSKDPAESLIGLSETWPVGIYALATHGRTGWSRLTMGSVAMHVVHNAPCPVLLVRPRWMEDDD
jgi:nucleotide-binding universal stress UspA family protein